MNYGVLTCLVVIIIELAFLIAVIWSDPNVRN